MKTGSKIGIKRPSAPTLTVFALSCVLVACENGSVQDNDSDDTGFVSAQSEAAEQGFGDLFWAEQAQGFEPFVAPPDLAPANGALAGRWSEAMDWPLIATGAANMPDGRILAWAATSIDNFGGPEEFAHGTIYDPETNTFAAADNDMHNAFCAGVAMLPDGSVFAAGGGEIITTTSRFNNDEWQLDDDLINPRWYPTSTVLPSGQVLVSLGTKTAGESELWSPDTGYESAFRVDLESVINDDTAQPGTADWFPAINVAPDGTLYHPGPVNQTFSIDLLSEFAVTAHGERESDDFHRLYNTTVMYDVGKMLMAGGGFPPSETALKIDLTSGTPQIAPTNAMTQARTFQNTIVLPNGEVLVIGGNSSGIQFSDQGTILTPEIWNPETETWRSMDNHSTPRNYHSTALLMKDARVIAMGGGLCGTCVTNHQSAEIFEPPYLFEDETTLAVRPEIINAPATAAPAQTLNVTASSNIEKFSLYRLIALTHHHSTDQRLIPLEISSSNAANGNGNGNGIGNNSNYTLELPDNPNVLLPGYYWLFALDANGTPSIGHTVQIDVVTDPITGIEALTTNNARLNFAYYEQPAGTTWNQLPDFTALTPVDTGITTSISLSRAQVDDGFAFTFDGRIAIPESGEYTFYLVSDDGSRLSIDGSVVVDHDGLHGPSQRSGSVVLGHGHHDLFVEYFESANGESLNIDIEGPGITRTSINSFLVPLSESRLATETIVAYEYYEGQWNTLPDFDALTPVKTGIQNDFSLEEREQDDNFGFRFSTSMLAEQTGVYTFSTRSDDGSQLFINGVQVVNNNGLHAPVRAANGVFLTPGWHDIVVTYFENSGGQTLSVGVQPPGAPGEQTFSASPDNLGVVANTGGTALVSYDYYHGSWASLPDFNTLVPVLSGATDTITLAPRLRDDDFGFRFRTVYNAPVTGTYQFITRSDDGSRLLVNGQTVVENDGLHAPRDRNGSVALTAGAHAIEVQFFERSGGEVLLVDVIPPGGSRQSVTPDTQAGSGTTTGGNNGGNQGTNPGGTGSGTNPPPSISSGVFYEYFEGIWSALPDFDALIPVATGNGDEISLASAQVTDNYAFRFTTQVSLATAGQYSFHTRSDDGSQLFVNGQLVVDNDGLHAAREITGNINLPAGTHDIVVTYFERTGLDVLDVAMTDTFGVRSDLNDLISSSSASGDNTPVTTQAEPVAFSYYEGTWTELPDFTQLTPEVTGTLAEISLDSRLQNDEFAFRFSSNLSLSVSGSYTFHVRSDDGSHLFINDQLVVNNDGLHAPVEISATLNLAAGDHPITLTYFELAGGEVLNADVTLPSGTRVPLSQLLAPASVNANQPFADAGF